MSNSDNLNLDAVSDLVEEASADATGEKEKSNRKQVMALIQSLSSGGKWNLLQEFVIEIQADGKLKEGLGQGYPTLAEQLTLLQSRIKQEFHNDPGTESLLTGYVTNAKTLSKWSKLPGWEDSVIDKMKRYGLFTPEKRSAAIHAMWEKTVKDKDTQAAKIWLTMSGDYSDKADPTDQKFEKYKEYANALAGKTNPDETK